MSNKYFYGTQFFVSASEAVSGATWTQCYPGDADEYGGSTMPLLDQTSGDLLNLFRMGETVKCPTVIGPVNFVLLKLADNSEVHICNFGIFSCSCSNILMTNDQSGETASIELVIDSSLATGDAISF